MKIAVRRILIFAALAALLSSSLRLASAAPLPGFPSASSSRAVTEPASAVTALAVGIYNVCAVVDGAALCWGGNEDGLLGDGTTIDRSLPGPVSGLESGVADVATYRGHACALTTGGAVWCWGRNYNGSLGNGSNSSSPTPVPVSGLSSGVTAITVSGSSSCALKDGGVSCWGSNSLGQLGSEGLSSSNVPVPVAALSSGVTAIDAGNDHVCALKTGGELVCWGSSRYGQVGALASGDHTASPVSVFASGVSSFAAGGWHTCAVVSGAARCLGNNAGGQLGNGSDSQSYTPVQVSGLESGVSAIFTGGYHTCALKDSGESLCWGRNDLGQVGDGSTTHRKTPLAVVGLPFTPTALSLGDATTCARSAAAIWCWGDNGLGKHGDGRTFNQLSPTPADLPDGPAVKLAAGTGFTCTTNPAGRIFCWGDNISGQLGDGSFVIGRTPGLVAGIFGGATALAAGQGHACAVVAGAVKCWGENYDGQLGVSWTSLSTTPVSAQGLSSGVLDVAVGVWHSCALLVEGELRCWGNNDYTQLGSLRSSTSIPIQVPGFASGAAAIRAGSLHTCALTTGGAVWCWGDNSYGQLGDGSTAARTAPVQVGGLDSGVIAIDAGFYHTCALKSGGALLCWGDNRYGQLGDTTTQRRLTPTPVSGLGSGVSAVSAGANHTCALAGGQVTCWGQNYDGQLGDGSVVDRWQPTLVGGLPAGIQAVEAGANHTCALLSSGAVDCWGFNVFAEMGDGTPAFRSMPAQVAGLASGPGMDLNYPDGLPGSFFRLVGTHFTAGAPVSLALNGAALGAISAGADGSFVIQLNTRYALNGKYLLQASAGDQAASTIFTLQPGALPRPKEGSPLTFSLPAPFLQFTPLIKTAN